MSVQLVSSPPFPLPTTISPPADIVMASRHVTLPSHRVKIISLHPLHLLETLCPVTSPLKLKLKH
jgi:hypothetical protein